MTLLAALALPLLLASGPAHAHAEKLMAFGRLVGQWEFTGVAYGGDGARTSTDEGEIQIAWILGGRALQDVWMETRTSDGTPGIYGTTVRFYDPKINAWRSVWTDPVTGVMRTFTGHSTPNGMVFEGVDSEGRAIRWVFSRITEASFQWHAEREVAPGTWRIYEQLQATRKRSG